MKNKFRPRKKPFILMGFFIFLMLVGIAVGESNRVLEQATAICLSCIGIG
ncbi:MAG: CD1871A family CXXC motif-containing protein [Desulfobulbaceae bacterium]|nr:CD1871A family CXXC motif-containing protein [Desulfobulbaceae bacterium]